MIINANGRSFSNGILRWEPGVSFPLEDPPAAPGGEVFFAFQINDIEQGVLAQTAAGMGGVLVE